jgi:uncharacterized phage protein gp47/JayE
MSTPAFIDDNGFHRPRLDQIIADFEADWQGIFGTDIDLSPESPDGQIVGIISERIDDIFQLIEATFNARSPAGASGAQLARLAALTGCLKKGEQFSTAPITLTGTPGTVVPAGSLIANQDDNTAVFQTTSNLTIGGGGTISGTVRATVTGPVQGPANKITVIKTRVNGWTAATNPSDASLGRLGETDPELRVRRAESVAIPSQGIVDSIASELGQVADVTDRRVYENFTGAPIAMHGGGTLAPHAIQAVVDGGDATDIANAIWRTKSGGCDLVGAQTVTITDTQGLTHGIHFDRPTDVTVYVVVNISGPISTATGNAIAAAIVAFGQDRFRIGQDVIWSQLFIPINEVGDFNVLSMFLGSSPSPSSTTNLTIGFASRSRWDVARITVAGT